MNLREAARLMGLPDAYALPARATEAFHLVGDGVAPPVVRFLSGRLLLLLVGDDRERDWCRGQRQRDLRPLRDHARGQIPRHQTGARRSQAASVDRAGISALSRRPAG